MKISIIGSGQVGSRIGKEFKKIGHDVIFFDVFENPLNELKKEGYQISQDLKNSILSTDASVIAVPTPLIEEKQTYDLSFIEDVAIKCGKVMKEKSKYHLFILKSTIVPGTTKKLFIPVIEKYSGKRSNEDFGVVYNPEFLTVIQNTWTEDQRFKITPDREGRIVLGGNNQRALDTAREIYTPIGVPIFETNTETAEAVKMTANSRLPLAVSFSNQITGLLEKVNKSAGLEIDVEQVVKLVHMDQRIGSYGSIYGKAYGGPCFKKDPNAFNTFIKETTGETATLIDETIKVNKRIGAERGVRE